jgi:hypothetical protein
MKLRGNNRAWRALVSLLLATGAVFFVSSPAAAATYESGIYYLADDGVSFSSKHKLTYTQYSDHLNVSRSDLYINVLTCCGSSYRFYCAVCKYDRNAPWPYVGFPTDDNNPAEFYYENTPAWAEVPMSYIGDHYWGGSVVKFNNRTSRVYSFCLDPINYFDLYAGIQLAYGPSVGWNVTPYSS